MRTLPNLPLPEIPTDQVQNADMLARALRNLIDGGAVAAGQRLPSTRRWAERLGIPRGILVSAFEQLCGEGYLVSVPGRGTQVHPHVRTPAVRHRDPEPSRGAGALDPGPMAASDRTRAGRDFEIDLTQDAPEAGALDSPRWRAAWRDAAGQTPEDLGPGGLGILRTRICAHLERYRQVHREPDEIVITAGTREGLALLRRALWLAGARIGVERPGYPTMRVALRALGCALTEIPVDAAGVLPPAGGARERVDALLVTPSHQYPFGGALQRERRSALLDWAHRTGGVILEDDYDAELREAGAPMPALCALDDSVEGRVVTMGTFSKLLSADVGVGYLVVPRRLLPAVLRVREALGVPVPWIAQAALADYLRSGDMQRHLARLRRRYRHRRETVAQMFAEVPGVRVLPMDGGLHSVVEVPGDERRLLNACVRSGVRVTGLSDYWGEDASDRAHGLVIGCANPEADAFAEGVRRIRRLVVSGA